MIIPKVIAGWFCTVVCLFVSASSFAQPANTSSSGMVIDLCSVSDFIKLTPEYSSAVQDAVLPYFSDMARRLNLPVPQPITKADASNFHVMPVRKLSASTQLRSGWIFNYAFDGHVCGFISPNSYFSLQNPDKIPEYYGQVRVSPSEAVELARDALKKMAVPLEDVFADRNPQMKMPDKIGTNVVPRYEIIWIDPNSDKAADFEINAENKKVERMVLRNRNLARSLVTVSMTPKSAPLQWPSTNPEYAMRLIPIVFKAIGDYAQTLSLPIPQPLTTNNVSRVEIHDNEGWPHAEVTLTNGWRFVYRHAMVNGFYSPNILVSTGYRPYHAREFEGKWNLTTNQAIELVKKTLAKLNYPTNNVHMDFAPNVICAAGDFKKSIPRYFFEWHYENVAHDDLQSKVEAEVNADNGKLESLYYDDKAYWGSRPAIDVPISVKN